jgi:hypothetical protein
MAEVPKDPTRDLYLLKKTKYLATVEAGQTTLLGAW